MQALQGDEATLFASGTLLDGDTKPLQPAVLDTGPCQVRLTLYEALSPVRRMFGATGNRVSVASQHYR